MAKPGFTFVEAIASCPTLYERRNKVGAGVDRMKWFKENSVIDHDADMRNLDIDFQEKIVCGKFVDIDGVPPLHEALAGRYDEKLGEKYQPCEVGLK